MEEEGLKLSEIIDVEFLQKFQDDFAQAVGVASISVDMEGNPVTKPSNFKKFCMDVIRKNPNGCKGCMECDRKGGEVSARTKKPYIYECHAGLVDFAAPIMIEGKQIGSILGGQILTKEPDLNKMKKVAKELGIEESIFMDALGEVEISNKDRVEKAAHLLYLVASSISQMEYNRIRIKKVVEGMDKNIHEIVQSMEEMESASMQVTKNQENLNEQIQSIHSESKEITRVLDFIKGISHKTKLLGLNASIEAARAGQTGLGFSVVAKEIQKLAEDSKDAAENINHFTQNIIREVDETVQKGNESVIGIQQQFESIQRINASIQALASITENMVYLAKS